MSAKKKAKYQSEYQKHITKLEKIRNRISDDLNNLSKDEPEYTETDIAILALDNAAEIVKCCITCLREKDNLAEEAFMLSEVSDKMEERE